MDWIILLLMLDRVPRGQRATFTEQLLPAILPGPAAQRLAVAAIAAEQQGRRQTVVEKNIVVEAVTLGGLKDAATLEKACPEIHRAFTRLPPDEQAGIFPAIATKPAK